MSNHTAVIGQPIEHSISPKIHNFWIKENGIEVGEYKKISLNKEDVKINSNSKFIEANTIEVSLSHLKNDCFKFFVMLIKIKFNLIIA